jgi:death-on-curing family protein
MAKGYVYPPRHSIIFINEIINAMSNRKADQHKLMKPAGFIDAAIKKAKQTQGDVYDKAAALLYDLVTAHGFASGNKRTGFITTLWFLRKNGGKTRIKNFNKAEKVITNLRTFSTDEIAGWLRTGDIDETKIR